MANSSIEPQGRPTPIWVVFGLAMGPAVALGLARFAYALLLAPMRAELGWSFADAGTLNTVNAAGYLAGAMLAAPWGRRFGEKRIFSLGLLATALAVGASGFSANFRILLGLRAAAGFTGALAFVAGAGLASAAAAGGPTHRAPTLLGIYFAGAGIGVTASALAVPPLLQLAGWRGGWMALGALSLLAAVLACLAVSSCPAPRHPPAGTLRGGWSALFLAPTLAAYALHGAGYIAYATFIVAFLRGEGFGNTEVSAFWTLLGLASVAAAFLWGPVLGRLRGGQGTAATIAVVALGALVPLLWRGPAAAFCSAILFGGSFVAVIAAVTSFARKATQPHAMTSAVSALTIAFGLGQCTGPVLSGALSDGPDGIRAGLWLSVGILVLAASAALLQREPGGLSE